MAAPWEQYQQAQGAKPWEQYTPQEPAMQPAQPFPEQQAQQTQVPQWGVENPNLYGLAGAAREAIGPVLEYGGLLGGGAMGAAGGAIGGPVGATAGGVAGAGLGYGAGKSATKAMDVMLGNAPPETVSQALRRGVGDVGEGAAMEMTGQSVIPAAKIAWQKVVRPATSSLIGDLATGAGAESMRQLVAAGKAGGEKLRAAVAALRGNEPMEVIVADAKGALREMKDARVSQYMSDMGKIAEAQKPIDFGVIDSAFKGLVDKFKIQGTWKVGKDTQRKIQEIGDTIAEWRKNPELHTTIGFDALKQRINDLMPNKMEAGKSGAAVTSMYNAIRDAIVKESPDYATAMKAFESSLKESKAIERELSLNDRAAIGTALRKLQSVARDNANTMYGHRADMVRALEEQGGANILTRIAGQASSSIAPRGLNKLAAQGLAIGGGTGAVGASALSPALLAGLPLMSPRVMGEAAIAYGKGAEAVNAMAKRTGISPEQIKQLAQGLYVNQENVDRTRQLSEALRRF